MIEARNAGDTMFGAAALESCICAAADPGRIVETVDVVLRAFRGDAAASDDLTLVEILCEPPAAPLQAAAAAPGGARAPVEWSLELCLGPGALRDFDPLPLVTQAAREIQGLGEYRTQLHMILSELYHNALDHGVLGLDSALKATPEGFAAYYDERERRLQGLAEGQVRIRLAHAPAGVGGRLTILVEDSGPGFGGEADGHGEQVSLRPSGRGLALVRSLTESLVHRGRGNLAEAVFAWPAP